MCMKPVVTVISCFYNAEKYIESYLNEISKQSFDNFEVVLINDGSTDQSDLLVKQLLPKYPFVKYFVKAIKVWDLQEFWPKACFRKIYILFGY